MIPQKMKLQYNGETFDKLIETHKIFGLSNNNSARLTLFSDSNDHEQQMRFQRYTQTGTGVTIVPQEMTFQEFMKTGS